MDATAVEKFHHIGSRRRGALQDVVTGIGVAVDLGLLQPWDRLPDDVALAEAFGVAPITVRRALTRLCSHGVLVRKRGRGGGTFVAPDPPVAALSTYEAERATLSGDVHDVLDYRHVLESGLLRRAVDRATRDQIRDLRDLVRNMEAAETWPEFRALDPRFHLAVAAIGGPQRAVQELGEVLGRLAILYYPHPIAYLKTTNKDHRIIVDAIAARDAALALETLDAHIEAARGAFAWMDERDLANGRQATES